MGSTTQTTLLDLPIFSDDDKPTWRGDINGAFNSIDAGYGALQGVVNDNKTNITTNTNDIGALKTDIVKKVYKGELVTNVKDYGAKGDGVTDDTAAFNAAIAAGAGGTVYVPPSLNAYMINADYDGGQSVRLNTPNTRINMAPGATLKAITNSLAHYAVIRIDAANCVVDGGNIIGDLDTHTGAAGEQGFGVEIYKTADNFVISNIKISKCWGDGVFVGSDSTDPRVAQNGTISRVYSTANRRQGCSVLGAGNLSISYSTFSYTGGANGTAPMAGLAFEPNADGQYTITATVTDCFFLNNGGTGTYINSNGCPVTVNYNNCYSRNNAGSGFNFAKNNCNITLNGCNSNSDASLGGSNASFYSDTTFSGALVISGCHARNSLNTSFGLYGADVVVSSSTARNGAKSGFLFGGKVTGSGLVASGCNTTTSTYFGQFHIEGTAAAVTLQSCVSDAGSSSPQYGFREVTVASPPIMLGCKAIGTFAGSSVAMTDAVMMPNPGATVQTLPAAGTVTADNIRAALVALGFAK